MYISQILSVVDPGEGPRWGGGGAGPSPSLFLDQTEAQRAEKKFLETCDLPFSKGLDDRP